MPETTPALAAPCGALMGWPSDEGRPCGRPKGHPATGGQVHPGHCYLAQPGDPPTQVYAKRVYWQIDPAPLEWGYGPDDAVTPCASEHEARTEAHERREQVWYRPENLARWTWSMGQVTFG